MIKGKTPEEIRKTFNIKNDFTPAEEEQVRIQAVSTRHQREQILSLVITKNCSLNARFEKSTQGFCQILI
jgi:hypothetical protein